MNEKIVAELKVQSTQYRKPDGVSRNDGSVWINDVVEIKAFGTLGLRDKPPISLHYSLPVGSPLYSTPPLGRRLRVTIEEISWDEPLIKKDEAPQAAPPATV